MPLSGTVQTIKNYHRSVSGVMSGTGSVGSSTGLEETVQGTLQLSGSLGTSNLFKRILVGTLTLLGSIGEHTLFKKLTSGIISFIGALDSFAGKVNIFGSFGSWVSHLSYTKNGISIGRKFFQLTKSLLITRWRNR